MKSITRIILGILLLSVPALSYAQTGSGEFRITGKSIVMEDDRLTVSLEIEASELNLSSRAALALVPTLRYNNDQIALEGIRYQGKSFQGDESGFLSIYKGVKRDDIFSSPYFVTVPYAEWMANAELVFRQFLLEGDKMVELPERVMMRDIAANNFPVDMSWRADRGVSASMVMFLQPAVERVKSRNATTTVKVDYPSGKTDILVDYGDNAAELYKIDTLLRSILGDKLIKVNSITITGYSSPDGAYATNQRLAAARAKGFQQHIVSRHDLRGVKVVTKAVGEDWDGLVDAINESDMRYKDEVLKIIASTDIFDGREKKLMTLRGGAPYREMLQDMFPSLRRIGIEVDYVVRSLTDSEARELLYTRPEMLSLTEMMRVASFYEPGSSQYRRVYEIAAKHFPKDVVANNNAAAAALLDGDVDAASRHLHGIDDKRVLVNRGVISYISGDASKAEELFTKACYSDIEKGCSNLQLMRQSIEDRNRELALAQAEYERVESARNTALNTPLNISIDRSSSSYRFAVKTNLMEWAGIFPNFSGLRGGVNFYGITPNLEGEMFFGGRWSVNLSASWSDFKTQDDRDENRWAVNNISLEPRIWFCQRNGFKGLFAGVYGSYGEFNMFFDGMQMPFSGDIFSAGVSAGYTFLITPHWSIEAGIKGGYFNNDYFTYFHNTEAFEKYENHKKSGFGLHSIRLSIGYRFGKMK